ncbi:AAA domain-containing protein [Dictyobacter formicarum]|uniref:DNA helicase n=1 Tax=Dictyobacter formicarum TaxID=2778368 RepID=A0ABQ3VR27_9CHLR|nr:AAA domain-containing protein [Dictyobacter formicarum]GHO87776.1 ATPase AAA [Dictyobacter formicarum]
MQIHKADYHQSKEAGQRHECFLCTLDPKQPCHTPQLSGRLVAAQERQLQGERVPIITLDTGTERVEVQLEDQYYRSLIKEIKVRGSAIAPYALKIQLYHLPGEPVVIEYKNGSRRRYQGNSYTLAVLESDILLNITALNQAEYCTRQYLLNRLIPSAATSATIRGNIVHYCFKELLKEHDRGTFTEAAQDTVKQETETALQVMQRHLDQAIELNSIDIALADVSVETMRSDVQPHLESLARWYESESNTLWTLPGVVADDQQTTVGNQVRAETFLLAPEIGLRGRLDIFWQQTGQQRLLELKTGGASGDLPKRDHRWQVLGYHALLAVRRQSKMKRAFATLLYSGTPGKAQAFGIRASIREIQRVNETRNNLILNHVTGIPSAPPGPSRCSKCAMLEHCQTVSALLQWQPPETAKPETAEQKVTATPNQENGVAAVSARAPQAIPNAERDFFSRYYHLLQIEGQTGEQQQAQLWLTPVEERIERGSAILGLKQIGQPAIQSDGWSLTFSCVNTSELREGDEILLSDGNPVAGEVVSGTITSISAENVTVWTRELIAQPQLIDRYDNDLVHVRTLQNLIRWYHVPAHIQDLVAGKIRPRFMHEEITGRADFNREQNLAVLRALQMKDYLLIHGPPGTGKTSVIAEIVKRLTEQGQRILLAAFTNQAVDNMLKRLQREGFTQFLRLGSERSVSDEIKPWLLKERLKVAQQALANGQRLKDDPFHPDMSYQDLVFDMLYTTPVVASTTATWSSDKYTPNTARNGEHAETNAGFAFDVAIIDEAGQLTIPAILGALRFARRFILVGDEKQLPPLVLSQEASEAGLADSLFSFLKQRDEEYMEQHRLDVSACVPLLTQYRMNKWISHFSSTVFYDQKLLAHASVANRRLPLPQASNLLQLRKTEAETVYKALDPKFPLVFWDVRDKDASPEAKQNNAEARAVRGLVAGLLARGIQPQDIGIIAPYRAQVANIRRHLFANHPDSNWQAFPTDTPLSVDTVDRFQGGERLVMIISFATSHEPASESQRRQFLIDPHRLNVALTRAQRKLILVGCVPALEPLPTFSRLITYCKSMNTLLAEPVAITAS